MDAVPLALGRAFAQVLVDGHPRDPDRAGDLGDGRPVGVERPRLLVLLPAARHPCLGRRLRPLAPPLRLRVAPLALVDRVGWASAAVSAAVLRLVDQRGGGRLEAGPLAAEEGFEGVGQVVDQVPAVGDLDGVGRAVPRPLGVGAAAIAGDDSTPGCAFSQAARLPLDRSGSRSTGRWRSRSTRIVP